MAKKTYLEKMGLKPVKKLSKTLCFKRARYLRRRVKQGDFKGKTLERAKYYARWYQWFGDNNCTR